MKERAADILKVIQSPQQEEKPQEKRFAKLPKASEFSGKRIKFPDGSIRKSNGKEWVKE